MARSRLRRAFIRLAALAVVATGLSVVTTAPASAATTVCAIYCDTRDPSLAQQETFPVANKIDNGRRIELHISDADGMGWASIDVGGTGDSVWLDRSWDGGSTWDGLLGKASIPSTWTGTRTLMYNLYDPEHHKRGLLRACGDANGVVCTDWTHVSVCDTYCDGTATSTGTGDTQPVAPTTLSGRTVSLHFDSAGMAWATTSGGAAGDEVWLDRSWDGGVSWPDGSSKGRTSVPSGQTSTATAKYNIDDPHGWLYGGAVRACGRPVIGQNGTCTAWARAGTSTADKAVDALMWSYDPNTAWWPSSWWNSAIALTAVIDYARRTGSGRYNWIVNRTFTVNKVAFAAGVRGSDAIDGDFISRSTDDSEWWALAWIDAYDLTGSSTYLNEAVTIANYVAGLWDTSTCGGGVWWDRERTYKNAVTNGLYIRIAAALHNRIPGDTTWLSRANTAWTWFTRSGGMINSSNLVNDGLTSTCQNNGQTVWTYNQGLAIGAGVELYRATGNAAVLTEARHLADAAVSAPSLVSGGILTESCDALTAGCDDNQKQFKGVFMRYAADLDSVTSNAYGSFATTQANSIWASDRNSLNVLGERWNGQSPASYPNVFDWRTTASGLEALLATP
jgi:hypothetical protein